MRLKLTFLLLALNIALGGYLFYFDKEQSTRSLLDATTRLILNPEFVSNLDRIEIDGTGLSAPWTLERGETGWRATSPYEWRANPYALEHLFFQLRQLSWESRFSIRDLRNSGRSLESYDLADPPVQIRLQQNGISQSLLLGAPTEIGQRLYLMSPDGEFIYVVPRAILDVLRKDLEHLLDRRIFGLSTESIRAVQVQDRSRSNVRVRLERTGNRWEFVSPIATAADPERVESMLQEWTQLEVASFMEGASGVSEIDGDAMRLTFEGMGQRETLVLSPPTDSGDGGADYIGRREAFPIRFRIRAEQVETLKRLQDNLRERRVLAAYSEDWSSLEIHFGDLGLTLQQLENGGWQVLYKDEQGELRTLPADPAAVDQLRSLMRTMEVQSFVSDAPSEGDLERFGLANPQRRLVLRNAAGSLVEFRIGDIPENGETLLYARTNQSSSVFLVRPHVLAALSLDPYAYRERTIRKLPPSVGLESLTLVHRPTGSVLLQEDQLNEREAVILARLKSYLRLTRVERFLTKPFADPLPLDADRQLDWPYRIEASRSFASSGSQEQAPLELFLSERLGGSTQYVGDPESGLVGILPAELVELLDPVLTEFPTPPEPPESVPPTEAAP